MPPGRGRGSGSRGRPKGARKAPGRRDTAPGRQDTSSPAPNAGTEVKKAPWSSVEVAAALGCKLEADERHSKSTRKYRENVCAEVFGAQLKKICGDNGVDGRYPFPVKERPERQGGNWTMVRSIELRSKNGKAIYGKAEIALRAILNHINPLFKRLFPDGKVPSGSNPDDVFAILEYNLAIRERKITDNVVDLEGGEAELKGKGMGKGKGSKGKRKAVGDEDEDEGEDEDEDEDEGEGEDEDGDGDDKKAEDEGEGEGEGEDGDDEKAKADEKKAEADADEKADKEEAKEETKADDEKADNEKELLDSELVTDLATIQKVDPDEYRNKNIYALAFRIFSYMGSKDPSCVEEPERKPNSSRTALAWVLSFRPPDIGGEMLMISRECRTLTVHATVG
jgi:hypothetical protein